MPHRKRHLRVAAAAQRSHHRQTLLTVLYLSAALLLVNAWLVSQQLLPF